jgi:hypothetical protein
MARVELRFETAEAIDPQFGNFPLTVIRLMTNVCFRRPDGSSSEAFEAVWSRGSASFITQRAKRGSKIEPA